MVLYRISDFSDLVGRGGEKASGRWHTAGRSVVYLADHPALALLESLVHFEMHPDLVPATFQLLVVEVVADGVFASDLEATVLSANWRGRLEVSRAGGDAWLAAGKSALLAVPSAIVPHAKNYLLNPRPPDAARVRVVETRRWPFD